METLNRDLTVLYPAGDVTTTTFPSRPATSTAPSTASGGVIDCRQQGGAGINNLWMQFFGTTTNDTTFSGRIIGWSVCKDPAGVLTDCWVPSNLLEFSCTLSTATGVDGSIIDDSEKMVDTIGPITIGTDGVNCQVHSPANNTPASLLFDPQGSRYVEVVFDMTGAVSANGVYRFV